MLLRKMHIIFKRGGDEGMMYSPDGALICENDICHTLVVLGRLKRFGVKNLILCE